MAQSVMAIILAQVAFESDTGLPEDRYVNTFHFNGAATDAKGQAISDALDDFYNVVGTSGSGLYEYLSPGISAAADDVTVKCYDVTSGPGGTPFHESTWTLSAPAGGAIPLPNEVALCLSFKSTPLPGAVEARRRGRVYIGPVSNVGNGAATGGARPTAGFMNTLLAAGVALHAAADANATPWVIYSRVNDTTSLVDVLWCDNAWDTQRRRGLEASGRTTITL